MTKYSVSCVEEYSGFIDYWTGHGHIPGPLHGAVGCVTLQCWPTSEETWQEIAGDLLGDVDEVQPIDGAEIDADAADEAIRAFVEKTYLDKDKDARPFEDQEETEDQDEFPTYLIVLHLFREES